MALSSGTRHALQEAGSWLVLGTCAIAMIFYFDDIKSSIQRALNLPAAATQTGNARSSGHMSLSARQRNSSSGSVELRAGAYGQFRAQAGINGSETKVLVDTGASSVALTDEDARDAGIFPNPSDYTVRIQTANGIGRAAPVVIDAITIGDITVHNVRALVNEPGTLHVTLLGMSFLSRLSKVDIGAGKMVLNQ